MAFRLQLGTMALVATGTLALSGCGGNTDVTPPILSPLTYDLAFAGGIQYTGSTQPMHGDQTRLFQQDRDAVVRILGNRELEIRVPFSLLEDGRTFNVGIDEGVSATYVDDLSANHLNVWKGTSGTIRAEHIGDHNLFTLHDLQIAADRSLDGNQASGAAVVNGTIEARLLLP